MTRASTSLLEKINFLLVPLVNAHVLCSFVQIVSSICEFVEGSTAEIRSGWRPLFGALRAVRMSCPPMTTSCQRVQSSTSDRDQLERTHHLRVVLDVFDAFLGTDNPGVFANAAVDCLLCLLKHVRGPTELQDQGDQDTGLVEDLEPIPLNLCQAALKYLERCAQMLSSMYLMPACPVFHSALRQVILVVVNLYLHVIGKCCGQLK